MTTQRRTPRPRPAPARRRRPPPAHRDRDQPVGSDPGGRPRTARTELTPGSSGSAGSAGTPQQRAMIACARRPRARWPSSPRRRCGGMPGFVLEPVHVLATRQPAPRPASGGRMHSSVRLRDEDVTTIDGIPVTTPVRTLRDLAGRIHPERLSQTCDRHALAATDPASRAACALRRAAPYAAARPARRTLRQLILARPDGYRPADSNLELRFESILDEAGEAPFARQVEVGDDDGLIGRVDFLDRDLGVIVEVQSALFHSGLGRRRPRCRAPRPTPSCRLDRHRGHRRGALAPQGRGRRPGAGGSCSGPTGKAGQRCVSDSAPL